LCIFLKELKFKYNFMAILDDMLYYLLGGIKGVIT
jgi:hypothetical protein